MLRTYIVGNLFRVKLKILVEIEEKLDFFFHFLILWLVFVYFGLEIHFSVAQIDVSVQ